MSDVATVVLEELAKGPRTLGAIADMVGIDLAEVREAVGALQASGDVERMPGRGIARYVTTDFDFECEPAPTNEPAESDAPPDELDPAIAQPGKEWPAWVHIPDVPPPSDKPELVPAYSWPRELARLRRYALEQALERLLVAEDKGSVEIIVGILAEMDDAEHG